MPVTSMMQLLHAIFSARGNIVRIDSCIDDSIPISLTVAIRLIGAPVNRYTPSINRSCHLPIRNLACDDSSSASPMNIQCLHLASTVPAGVLTPKAVRTSSGITPIKNRETLSSKCHLIFDICDIKHLLHGYLTHIFQNCCPDSKVYGANMGPTWGRQDSGGPHVGLMNLAFWVMI